MNDKTEDRKHEILMAAMQAFTAKGYDKTSMKDIVEISGLSKGTLYWYFKSKTELFSELVKMTTGQILGTFDEVLDQTADLSPVEALRQMFRGAVAVVQSDPHFSGLTLDFMLQALHEEQVLQEFAGFYVTYTEKMAALLQRGVDEGVFRPMDTQHTAGAIIGLLDGVMLQPILQGELQKQTGQPWNIETVLLAAENLVLSGLLLNQGGTA